MKGYTALMKATTTSQNIKRFGLAMASVAAAVMLVIGWLTTVVGASSIVQVTSNIADVPGGANLVLTVGTQNDGDVYELEIDHSLSSLLPEFSVYADEANPYGGATCGPGSVLDCKTEFNNAGVTVTYSAAANQWVIDFGQTVTDVIRDNGKVNFYFVLRDANKNTLWGSMGGNGQPAAEEGIFRFDAVAGTGDSLIPDENDEDDYEEVVVPGVPNTSLAR